MLLKHTLRLDAATTAAVEACARAEHKTTTDVMREGIRLRLEVGALIEPVRLAILEIESGLHERIEQRMAGLQAEIISRLSEVMERERETTRADINDFIAGLSQYEEASRGQSVEAVAASPRSVYDALAK